VELEVLQERACLIKQRDGATRCHRYGDRPRIKHEDVAGAVWLMRQQLLRHGWMEREIE
jgi:hypothetical protein